MAVGCLILALVGIALIWPSLARSVIYQPKSLSADYRDPADWGFPGQSVEIPTADGERLHGWLLPSIQPEACGVVLFLHGNAGHVGYHEEFTRPLRELGLDVLLFDYRGFGASSGQASESGLRLDAAAAYEFAVRRYSEPMSNLLIVGHSLGSALAVGLAATEPSAGLVVVAPFSSLPSALDVHLPGSPSMLLRWPTDRFDSYDLVRAVDEPLLFLVGSRDQLVPAAESRRLYDVAPDPKQWVVVPAGHNEIFRTDEARSALLGLVSRHLGCGSV